MKTKTCSRCKESLPLSAFYKGRAQCIQCRSKLNSQRYDRPAETRCINCSRYKPTAEIIHRKCKTCRKRPAQKPRDLKLLRYENGRKECTKCHEVKPLDQFSANTTSPDLLQYHCKHCNAMPETSVDLGSFRLYPLNSKEYILAHNYKGFERIYSAITGHRTHVQQVTVYLKPNGLPIYTIGAKSFPQLENKLKRLLNYYDT